MRPYLAYIRTTLRLTARDRVVVFFNYLMPLLFFLGFGEGFGARTSQGALSQTLAMVLMFGVLGSGFFGGGLRATADRESGILRRFKVAPISPAPILVASIVTGWCLFIPSLFLFVILGHFRYGMEIPSNFVSLFVIVSAGALAFRALGLIVASIANSMAESQIIIQLLYLPMLMLSGATVPLGIMPDWLQAVAQFLPATHFYLGMQGILVRGESLLQNLDSLGAMLLTLAAGLFISVKLFRWEKEDKIKPAAKLWVLAVLAPFLFAGSYQAWSKDNLRKTQSLTRQMRRSQTWLIRDARLFVGDGRVIERGSLLLRNGRIVSVFDGASPDPDSLQAEAIEAAGRTVLPALIDSGVQSLPSNAERALAAYLYSGIAAIVTAPDPSNLAQALQKKIDSAEIPGPEILLRTLDPAAPSLLAVHAAAGRCLMLKDPLFLQTADPATPSLIASQLRSGPDSSQVAAQALATRLANGEVLVPMSRSGFPLIPHGPGLHREMQLWVQAGVAPKDVLRAATFHAARLAGAGTRLGLLQPGFEATLLIVDGNPLEDIAVTARIHSVLFKGERVARQDMLEKVRQKSR